MEVVRVRRPDLSPGGALRPRPFAPGRLPLAPSCPAACRGRLAIGYQITGKQLRGTVQVACNSQTAQASATLVWAARLDGVSRRVLLDALRAAACQGAPARLHVFAAAARDLFRHVSKTLAPGPVQGARRRRTAWAAFHRRPLPPALRPETEAGTLHDRLLAAARDLRSHARLTPHVSIVQGARTDPSLQGALSALRELSDLTGDFLERVLWPLVPHMGRHAVQSVILQTRREVRRLAACHTLGDVYAESLAITRPHDRSISFQVEGSTGSECDVMIPEG